MIYRNGSMQLICIKGQGERDALFICISNNELIQAVDVHWLGNSVSWGAGNYLGEVKNHIKL